MNHEFWENKWRSGQKNWHQKDVAPLLKKYFPRLPLNSKVMVPLCGKSLDMIWLAEQGYKVVGVELTEMGCEEFFLENKLSFNVKDDGDFRRFRSENIELLQGDFFKLNQNHFEGVCAVYDRAALIALPAIMRERYAQIFRHFLPQNAEQLVMTITYNENEMQGPPFSVTERELKHLYGSRFRLEKLHEQEIIDDADHLKEKGCTSILVSAYFLKGLRTA